MGTRLTNLIFLKNSLKQESKTELKIDSKTVRCQRFGELCPLHSVLIEGADVTISLTCSLVGLHDVRLAFAGNHGDRARLIHLAPRPQQTTQLWNSAVSIDTIKNMKTTMTRVLQEQNARLDQLMQAYAVAFLFPQKRAHLPDACCAAPDSKRRRVGKKVRWNLEKSESFADKYKQEDRRGLWWSKKDMQVRSAKTVDLIKTERSARAYVVGCQKAYKNLVQDTSLSQLFTSEIVSAMKQYDYRGLEGLPPPRGKRVRAVNRSIAECAKGACAQEKLAVFAREATMADYLWAQAIAVEDERVARSSI